MNDLVLVKLGGAMLTDKTSREHVRTTVLAAAAADLRDVAARMRGRLVVAHGSGSFAHMAAADTGFALSPTPLATAMVAAAARRLNSIVVEALIETGLPALGLPGAALVRSSARRTSTVRDDVLTSVLGAGLVPVIYGDAIPVPPGGGAICTTEALVAGIARSLGAARIVLATDVDGVYPPGSDRSTPIPFMTASEAIALAPLLGNSAPGAVDVTGGMSEKVLAMAELLEEMPSIEVWIVNGTRPGMLVEALTGSPQVGTRLAAEARP